MELRQLKNPKEVENLALSLKASHIGHELILTDNIGSQWDDIDGNKTWTKQPVKVVGAIIVLCVSGYATYRINLTDHFLKKDEILIILPGSIMQVIDFSNEFRIATISFSTQYYEPIVNINQHMRECPIIRPSAIDFEECINIYQNLNTRIAQKSDITTKSIAKGYIQVICSILFDYWRDSSTIFYNDLTRPKELYKKFLSKVQNEYHMHRSVKHYADSLCVTPKYLSMVVKRESGRNASEFIDEMIVFEAKALLADDRYTVQQVAEMMNFPNPSFFAKFFKQRCGISPSGYKRQAQ